LQDIGLFAVTQSQCTALERRMREISYLHLKRFGPITPTMHTNARQDSLLLNITREVFGSLIVFAFCQFSLSNLKEGIAPRLSTKLPLNLQQKAKKTLIGLLAT
jgi:hypothetical protein